MSPGAESASPAGAQTSPGTTGLASLAVLTVVATIIFIIWTATQLYDNAPPSSPAHWVLLAVSVAGAASSVALLRPAAAAVVDGRTARRMLVAGDAVGFRVHRARSRNSSLVAMGSCLAAAVVALFVLFLLANNRAVQQTFFAPDMVSRSWLEVTKAFGTNLFIAVVGEVIVLAWGLVVALARLAPGRAGRPIAFLATAYIDAFRAVPAIIVIYLVGFGLPLAGVPVLSAMSPTWAAIFALALVYGAYVAEVYRAGIQSIHPSQMAAARSLGLSYSATMQSVIVPQAIRRVVPPLLNDFIGLQKDTSLVTVIGTVDAFTQAKIYSSNYFNLSSVTVVAALFIVITIPQTRFVDRMLARDQNRMQARG